ncbi:MAG: hypothetical protein DRH57_06860 [Candidatus Cloacimonadota bacterium]|nr:MAG: hypothetical protein DRH57_06860 [Candidatus Cloacimonadota bacterium]
MKELRIKTMREYKRIIELDKRISNLNTNVDGRDYYVYRVYDIKLNQYYYGSRIRARETIESDFWYYGTSSSKKHEIIDNPTRFRLKIIKILDSAKEMIILESYLHKFFNVKNHINFWNKSNQLPWGFNTSGNATVRIDGKIKNIPIAGVTYKQSEWVGATEGTFNVKDEFGNISRSTNTNENYLNGLLVGICSENKHTNKTKEKMRTWRLANKSICSQEGEKNSQFGTKWVINCTTGEVKKVSKAILSTILANGWRLGRK